MMCLEDTGLSCLTGSRVCSLMYVSTHWQRWDLRGNPDKTGRSKGGDAGAAWARKGCSLRWQLDGLEWNGG
jgi:hypothetical protein